MTKEMKFRAWAFGILAVLATGVSAYAFIFFGSLDQMREMPLVQGKNELPSLWIHVLWAHALSAGTALLIGWLQFVKKLRVRSPRLHRIIGYIYSLMIIIGAVTGFYLAFYADGGWIASAGFAGLAVSWLFTLYHGLFQIIVKRDHAAHRRWMTYNYALTCAAIMLRIYIPLGLLLFGIIDTNETFDVIAWICWVPNLLAARLFLGAKPKNKARHSVIL
ncbi:DUF2306 domain-containing protein [Paenibacillus sp. NEAU-GSW1]|uniref:DUF2306 domain-containing protein n=1 Tax=Paenibacillus sp. NEAU-GSW1 TaxID=2682486 RepID=UPI0012E1B27A|nr:DUF2306 domain-containing protein [Paenibacillus sp. NEAU-GSW1]MUT65585.1 DUF2306 domain-containing protein [Paenibacillus sp. NEAU-GSW1]